MTRRGGHPARSTSLAGRFSESAAMKIVPWDVLRLVEDNTAALLFCRVWGHAKMRRAKTHQNLPC